MRKILILLMLAPIFSFGQSTTTTLTTQVDNTVRGKTYSPSAAADMYQAIVNASPSGTASGTNTYAVSVNGSRFTSYSQLNYIVVTVTNANSSGTCTLNINSLGALSIKGNDGNDLSIGALKAGGTYLMKYTGTNIRVMNDGSGGGGGSDTVESVTGDGVDNTDPANPVLTFPTKSEIGLGSVENTALSTWPGTANVTILGTIGTGTWNGSVIGSIYGGTGINNGGRTLTLSTNSGTLIFTNSSTPLTIANTASISGTNTGDQTITLTGDVTGSGTGSFATTIASLAVTNAKINDVAIGKITTSITGLLKGNGSGVVQATSGTDYEPALTFSSPLSRSTNTISIPAATSSINGYITSTDWLAHSRKASQRINYVNAQTGTSYTLSASDSITSTLITMNNASPNNVVLPKFSTVPFRANQFFYVEQIGDGVTSFVPEDGTVTVTYEAGVAAVVYKKGPNMVRVLGTNSYHVYNGTPPPVKGDLTRTNGSFITTTFTGPTTNVLNGNSVNILVDITSPITSPYGGLGLIGIAQGSIVYGSATNTYSELVKNTSSTRYLSNTGTSNNPAWAQIALATGVSGTLPIANGGTGSTTGASGSFSGSGTATTVYTVTIGTTQGGTTYKVQMTPTNALSAAVSYVTNKTTTTFDVTYLSGLTGTVAFDWLVTP